MIRFFEEMFVKTRKGWFPIFSIGIFGYLAVLYKNERKKINKAHRLKKSRREKTKKQTKMIGNGEKIAGE